jgi:hypothetical protein
MLGLLRRILMVVVAIGAALGMVAALVMCGVF